MQTVKQYLAALDRVPGHRPPHSSAACRGGPWDGQKIFTDTTGDGATAVLTCGAWRGYYARLRGVNRQHHIDAYGNPKLRTALKGPAIWYSTT